MLADLRLGGPQALGVAKRLVREVPHLAQGDAFPRMTRPSAELSRASVASVSNFTWSDWICCARSWF